MRISLWPIIGLSVQYVLLFGAVHNSTSWPSGFMCQTLDPEDQGRFPCVHILQIIFFHILFSPCIEHGDISLLFHKIHQTNCMQRIKKILMWEVLPAIAPNEGRKYCRMLSWSILQYF